MSDSEFRVAMGILAKQDRILAFLEFQGQRGRRECVLSGKGNPLAPRSETRLVCGRMADLTAQVRGRSLSPWGPRSSLPCRTTWGR